MECCKNLSYLAKNFVYTATLLAKMIVNEINIPFEKKSFQPINIGGQAGGLKYLVHDILVCFLLFIRII